MKTKRQRQSGMTLIEILVSLLIVGVLVGVSGLLLSPLIQGFLNARQATELLHQGQIGMARIVRELTTVTNVVSGNSVSITYDTLDSTGVAHRRSISWGGSSGDALLLSGNTLIDDVARFQLSYLNSLGAAKLSSWGADSSIIEVVIDFGVHGSVYTNRICPRNLR
mgnify:CR=1 FL=1